ncbi:hypothetical protein [Croceimicrobium hydrocarbonivorans]|uniref:Uncharacterized protein n=1 Tax=Croceimicrobium hydrocarbonivorans TaxID=2761580 RepID=A0A7H0VIP3_9FLAO|nr:hypothetical protein [Croceimicrobium hydrocarbonivorans]QNR25591.1 hypothetical protein H4K34_07040 [Croceimicrobium hydrocarbonivorans]
MTNKAYFIFIVLSLLICFLSFLLLHKKVELKAPPVQLNCSEADGTCYGPSPWAMDSLGSSQHQIPILLIHYEQRV